MSGPAAPPSFYCKGRTGEYVELLDLFKPLSEIPEMDTSYFKPWTLGMLYEVEPELEAIATRAVAQKRRRLPGEADGLRPGERRRLEAGGLVCPGPALAQ